MEWIHGDYVLSDDRTRLDLEVIGQLLASTYWASDRTRAVIGTSLEHSVCFGLFHQGRQAGFARAVTDHATFAWICDVIVHADHRGRGLGTWKVARMLEHPALQTITQLLRTRDAHGLYERFGFQPADCLRRSQKPSE